MYKITLLFTFLFLVQGVGNSQCNVNPFIEDNYAVDANILVLREILGDPQDPDFDNPFIPKARVTPVLEKLSAIYENPNGIPIIDSIFNELNIHFNNTLWESIPYNGMGFSVDINTSWVQAFKDTGVSGFAPLDTFLNSYELYMYHYIDLTSQGITRFFIDTHHVFLNTSALVDELEGIQDIISANANCPENCPWINYTGVPYLITSSNWGNHYAEACDISKNNDTYTFTVAGGDCLTGCIAWKRWMIEVSEDCETVLVLDSPNAAISTFTLYPNPASDTIRIMGVTSQINSILIYTVTGKLIQTNTASTEVIDISSLQNGIYFLAMITSEGNQQIQKFIKN